MALFKTRRTILIGYLLSILMVFFFAFYANRDMARVRRESTQAENIIFSLSNLERILDDMQDIETGQRGFLLAGDSLFLEPFFSGLQRIGQDTGKMEEAIRLFPDRAGEIRALLQYINAKIDFAKTTVDYRAIHGFDTSLSLLTTNKGRRLMDSIRSIIHRIEESQRVDLATENLQRKEAAKSTASLFNIMAVSFFAFLSLLFWYANASLRTTERYEKKISYLANLTENTSDAIVSTDMNGKIISWNKAAEIIFGHKAGEVMGRYAPDVLKSGFSREMLLSMRAELLRTGVLNNELLYFDKQGRPIHCLVSTTPLKDAKGDLFGFVSAMRDISERKRLEEQLRLFNRELSRQVEEQTSNLREANEQLAVSNRDLEQFAYIASHDLQEPLRAVRSFLQLLEKKYADSLDDQAKLYISQAVDGASRMKELITDLLNFSRVGKRQLKIAKTDLNELVRQVITALKPAIAESGTTFKISSLPPVYADPVQLGLVFQNLIGNAIKYRRKDVPPVIEIQSVEKNRQYEFAVRDNGIGFGREHWDSIFNVFYRLHTPAEYPGTGIGLAICKKIIELHNGKVWVQSEPGVGSTFFFSLPIEMQGVEPNSND